jgi:hypothetical protein
MRKTTEEIGAYGLANGLGFHGDPKQKAKLVRRASKAVERGHYGVLLEYLLAYGAGSWAGARVRRAITDIVESAQIAPWE